ncbi:hypothetical protein HYQ45_012482 [Verticillium longisporum]|uniref:C2H2-type domain-containing protein n=1 Tax=Verticillium longisporum TaxID=100787 RepID=A0A8I2ZFM8_VERLO|nr:hypothetical protein HYQ44_011944 [Verticillium longisporum]KAG7127599.1 hypothetical protein HYQ45_012482 [Verticillium longisporum]
MPKSADRSVRVAESSSSEPTKRKGAKSDSGRAPFTSTRSSGHSSSRSSGKASKGTKTCAVQGVVRSAEPSSVTSTGSSLHTLEESAFIKACIAKRNKQLVDNLMEIIQECIDNSLGTSDEAQDGNESGRSSSSRGGSKGARFQGSTTSLAGQKRQLQRGDDSEPPSDDRGDKNGKDRNSKRAKTDSDDSHRKFACPYNKYNPKKWNSGACCGPGFPSWHRLKEHLLRKHRLPRFPCKRCWEYFADDAAFEDHVRSEIPCRLRNESKPDPVMGFDMEKETKLRARVSPKISEAQHWSAVYCILFDLPEGTKNMPSPYYDVTPTRQSTPSGGKSPLQLDEGFRRYCRRQLPNAIRREIEEEIDRKSLDLEDHMRGKFIDIVEGVQVRMYMNYRAIQSPEEVSTMGDPNMPVQTQPQCQPSYASTVPPDAVDEYESWTQALLPDLEGACEGWDPTSFAVGDPQPANYCDRGHLFCDSAYCSNPSLSVDSAADRYQGYGSYE